VTTCALTCIAVVPEIITVKKIVVLSIFYGNVDRSCSDNELQEIPDVDGIVGG